MIQVAPLSIFLLLSSSLGHPDQSWSTLSRRGNARKVPPEGFYNASAGGGSMLTIIPGLIYSEPLNAIVSGNSDAEVLVDEQVHGGLINYFLSLGFAGECLGQTDPGVYQANLGDGAGAVNQTGVLRWDYGDPSLGTCTETIQGGNHFRYWFQDGPTGDSGAIFMACSYEMPLNYGHDVIPNGYNLGRDWLVGNITGSTIPTSSLTNTSAYNGTTSANGYTYQTAIQYLNGYIQNTSIGINHNDTVPVPGENAVDGLVALLTVKIISKPLQNDATSSLISARCIAMSLLLSTTLSLFFLLP